VRLAGAVCALTMALGSVCGIAAVPGPSSAEARAGLILRIYAALVLQKVFFCTLTCNKRQILTLGVSSHRLSSSYLRTRIRVIFLREREDIHVRDFVIDDEFQMLGSFSYLRAPAKE
jgi:hypothetical protein